MGRGPLHCPSPKAPPRNGVNVVAISVDNSATNRKFFIDCLCQGTLKTHVIDEFTGQPIFLHLTLFKQSRISQCPAMTQNLLDGCCTNLSDIKDLYNTECSMAFQLHCSRRASGRRRSSWPCPSSWSRRTTHYSSTKTNEGRSAWAATTAFISLILKLWNVQKKQL